MRLHHCAMPFAHSGEAIRRACPVGPVISRKLVVELVAGGASCGLRMAISRSRIEGASSLAFCVQVLPCVRPDARRRESLNRASCLFLRREWAVCSFSGEGGKLPASLCRIMRAPHEGRSNPHWRGGCALFMCFPVRRREKCRRVGRGSADNPEEFAQPFLNRRRRLGQSWLPDRDAVQVGLPNAAFLSCR